jgi:laminin B (domain IV)
MKAIIRFAGFAGFVWFAGFVFGVPAAAQAGRTLIQFEFTESAEGWQVSGDTAAVEPIFDATGGHPGGCITAVDAQLGETWYFRAPAAVVQQLPAAIGGTISFSLKQDGGIPSLVDDDVVIVGPAGRLSYRFPKGPGGEWTDFSVQLSEKAGWTWNWNRKATRAQIESVLVRPSRLEIRGEYVTGPDQGWLDNFKLIGSR